MHATNTAATISAAATRAKISRKFNIENTLLLALRNRSPQTRARACRLEFQRARISAADKAQKTISAVVMKRSIFNPWFV
jgi:hypothetical protein